uniref:Uncharacterized protein n=1 Tax=Romanomermis culicivorax TaxID=13658 RepID=A0A915KIB7_ROMCU
MEERRVTRGVTKPKGSYKDLGLNMPRNAEDLASDTTLPRTRPVCPGQVVSVFIVVLFTPSKLEHRQPDTH